MRSDVTVRQGGGGGGGGWGLNFRLTFYKVFFITQASVVMNTHLQLLFCGV